MERDFDLFPVTALTALAEKVGRRPLATVFLSEGAGQILVASMTSPTAGLYLETKSITKLAWDTESHHLGRCVWEALLRFREDSYLGSGLKRDWPAYQASSARSARSFEEQFVRCNVEAFPCFLRVEADVPVKAAEGLFVGQYITNACEFGALGNLIHQIYRCAWHIVEAEYS